GLRPVPAGCSVLVCALAQSANAQANAATSERRSAVVFIGQLYQIDPYFCVSTHSARRFESSAESPAFGGIGTAPQTPLPPARIFSARRPAAPASPEYFCATSRNAGPTSFFATSWHDVHALAASSFAIGSSLALARVSGAGAGAGSRP